MSPRWLFVVAACLGLGAAEYLLPCYISMYSYERRFDLYARYPKLEYCTHIILGHTRVTSDEDPYSFFNTYDLKKYDEVKNLKAKYPKMKTILSIGGPLTESWIFCWKLNYRPDRFVDQIIDLAKMFNFDGVDVAWLYPSLSDKGVFAGLVNMFKKRSDGKLIITATVSGDPVLIRNNYDAVSFADSVDFLNVQTYGYHDNKRTTGLNAPLFSSGNDTSNKNVADSMNLWAELGIPKHKLVMGISAYGQSYLLDDKNDTRIGAPALVAAQFRLVDPEGVTPYEKVLGLQRTSNPRWVDGAEVPYLVNGSLWTSFENSKSITQKIEFVKRNGFGGVFHNGLEYDYPFTYYNTGFDTGEDYSFEVLSTIKAALDAESTTELPTTTPITTTMDPSLNPCIADYNPNHPNRFVADNNTCSSYYFCHGVTPYHLSCREGLYFSASYFSQPAGCGYYHFGRCGEVYVPNFG